MKQWTLKNYKVMSSLIRGIFCGIDKDKEKTIAIVSNFSVNYVSKNIKYYVRVDSGIFMIWKCFVFLSYF